VVVLFGRQRVNALNCGTEWARLNATCTEGTQDSAQFTGPQPAVKGLVAGLGRFCGPLPLPLPPSYTLVGWDGINGGSQRL
jgi:hypothetical protein